MEPRTSTTNNYARRAVMTLLVVLTSVMAGAYDLTYQIELCKGGVGNIHVKGWVIDPLNKNQSIGDNPNNSIEVSVTVSQALPNDEAYRPMIWGVEPVVRPDVNSANNCYGTHGFEKVIPVDWGGTLYVWVNARTNQGNGIEEFLLGDNPITLTVTGNDGDGDVNPFLIHNASDWNALASAMTDEQIGNYYADSKYILADDFNNSNAPVSTMFGLATRPFTGTFDGNGKTLNVNLSGPAQYMAPFAYTDGVTIKNLTVAGTFSASSAVYAGGIVGHAATSLNIENCVCSATISGITCYASGLIGLCEDMPLTISNCLFKGAFLPGSGGMSHPIALKNPEADVMTPSVVSLYVNTTSPSEGLDNHLIAGVQGIPVSTTQVAGSWTVPLRAADGVTYYSQAGGLDFCLPLSGNLMVKGWAFDPDQPSESNDVEVHIYSDAACANEVKSVLLHANHSRPDINDTYLIPGSHEFQDFIPISDAGTYYVKFIATDLTGNDNQQIGDPQEVNMTTNDLRFVKDVMTYQSPDYEYNLKGWNHTKIWSEWDTDASFCFIAYLRENSIGINNEYVTDLYLSDAPNPVPDELTYNGRTYYLAPYEYDFHNGNSHEKGSLTYRIPGPPLHLYYTRDPFGDNRAISNIIVNNNSDGAVGLNGSSQGCRINYGNYGDLASPVYLHFTTAKTIPPFTHEPPYSYSFDRPLVEEGWKAVKCGNETGITGEKYFHFNSAGTDQYLISSMFESGVPMKLTFNAKSDKTRTRFCIGYSKTGNEVSAFTWDELVTGSDWQQLEYEVPASTKYVAIKTIENTLDLDDFNFESFYVKASDVQLFAATVTWTAPLIRSFARYKYQYKKSDEDTWSDEVLTQDQFVTLSKLTDNTSYDFRVRAVRENGADGDCANFTFKTLSLPSPVNLSVSEKSDQTATFTWSVPETEYDITGYSYQWKKANDENWSTAVPTTGTSVTLTNLDTNTHYSFRVKTLYDQHESLYVTTDFVVFPYTYGFDRPLAEEGWKMVDNIRDTGVLTDSSGNKKFRFRLKNGDAPQYLISTMLDCPTFLLVAFTYGVAYGEEGDIQVGYSTTTDDIEAFTWDTKILVSKYIRYEKVFPKGVKYIAVKATFNSDVLNCRVILDDFRFSVCDTPSPHSVTWDESHEHSTQLTWTAPDTNKTITGYGYQYKKASDSNWSAETSVASNVTTVTLTNLAAATNYDFRVRTLYENNEQSTYLPFSFTTAWELPYDCGFENGMNGMHTTDYFDNGFSYSTTGIKEAALRSGRYGYRIYAVHSKKSQYLISPVLSNTLVKKLTFYYTCGGIGFYERFQVGYSTTSDEPWAFIWDNEIVTRNYETWTKYEKILPAECRYVAIKYNSTDAYAIYIDDFSIEENSTYQTPSNLVATDLPEQIATRLTWTAPSTQPTGYAYQYKKANDNTWSDVTTTDASTTTVTLSGLPVNTDYQFRVKALYAGGYSNFETVTFVSDAGIEPLPYEWGFEKGLGGFRVANNVRESQVVHYTWHEGAHCFHFSRTNGNEGSANTPAQYLVSPQFNCQSALKVSFYYRISYNGPSDPDLPLVFPAAFQVGYSTKTKNIDDFEWRNEMNVTEAGWHQYTCDLPEGTKYVAVKWLPGGEFLLLDDFRFEGTNIVHLADNADNTATISGMDGSQNSTVYLDGRTLYRDGDWNTICLPFALSSFAGTPLDGFEVRELDTDNDYNGHKTGVNNGTLYLNFKKVSSIVAGRPYLVKNNKVAGADASLATYYALIGSWGYDGENYQKLLDGTPTTKWCSTYLWQDYSMWSCDFRTSDPIYVTGYTLTGGYDMFINPDRAPRIWKLKAQGNNDSDWIIIDERNVEENNDVIPTEETTPTSYAIAADKQGVYQFFRIEILNTGGELMQLGELTLQGTLAPGTIADITNPVFSGVTVSKVSPAEQGVTSDDGKITFQGTYAPLSYSSEDKSILFLGAGNTLYYPMSGAKIGAQRAYFKLNGVDAGVREFRLNFGDGDEETGISSLTPDPSPKGEGSDYWYTLDGLQLSRKPTKAGLYINGGRKVAIK